MRTGTARFFPWMGLFLALSSCALLFPDRTAPKSLNYNVAPPSEPWHRLESTADSTNQSMRADLAYENPLTGAIISLNSLCRKYTDLSLENLTLNLVRGIGNRQVIEKNNVKIDGADALDTLFSGVVDGVKLNIRTIVLMKNSCTYDFIFVSIPKREGDSKKAFESFLASFKVNE